MARLWRAVSRPCGRSCITFRSRLTVSCEAASLPQLRQLQMTLAFVSAVAGAGNSSGLVVCGEKALSVVLSGVVVIATRWVVVIAAP